MEARHFCIRMVAEPSVDGLPYCSSYPSPFTNRHPPWTQLMEQTQLGPLPLQAVWLSGTLRRQREEDERSWGQASSLV